MFNKENKFYKKKKFIIIIIKISVKYLEITVFTRNFIIFHKIFTFQKNSSFSHKGVKDSNITKRIKFIFFSYISIKHYFLLLFTYFTIIYLKFIIILIYILQFISKILIPTTIFTIPPQSFNLKLCADKRHTISLNIENSFFQRIFTPIKI